MNLAEHHDHIYVIFTVSAKHLKVLPVVNSPWAVNVMKCVAKNFSDLPLDLASQDAILEWAERFGFLFRIGQGNQNEIYYFVPMLATEIMGETAKFNWSDEEESHYKSPNTTVLYAFLNFPASHQFYNCLLAELLKDCSANSKKLYINLGCEEAILTLSLDDTKTVVGVMVIYHQLQNVIEFRYRCVTTGGELVGLNGV